MRDSNKNCFIFKLLIVTVLSFTMNFSHAEVDVNSSKISRPFIYKVTNPTSTKPSYLFGSWHYGVSTSELPAWVNRLHNNARANLYEMDIASVSSYRDLQQLYFNPSHSVKMGFLPNSRDTVEKLVELGVSETVAPYFIISTCGFSSYFKEFAYQQPLRSLDYEFIINTKLSGKKLTELETAEIRRLAEKELPEEEQDEECYFKDMLDDMEKAKYFVEYVSVGLRDAVKNYRSGDESLWFRDEEDADLVFRNNHWMEMLTEEIDNGNSFTVVGLGHLFGQNGLIALLEKKGYTVARISQDPNPEQDWIRWRK